MQKKWRLFLSTVILAISISLNGGLASAGDYSVNWWRVQKRTYESGKTPNVLAFIVQDQDGNYPQTDVVQTIVLVGPEGPVSLTAHAFKAYDQLNGSLETSSGEWDYGGYFFSVNYYLVEFTEEIVEDDYKLTVIDKDGVPMSIDPDTCYFSGVVELPQISSKSFRGFEDAGGNLLWQWDMPDAMATQSLSSEVDLRCMLDVFNGDDYAALVWINIPSIMGGVMIPSDVMDLVRQKGDNFKLSLQIRDMENNNRYYSSKIKLSELKKERRKTVVVIPLYDN